MFRNLAKRWNPKRSDIAITVALALLVGGLVFVPTGFEDALPKNARQVKTTVVETDDSHILQHGIVRSGAQMLRVRIEQGEFEGQEIEAVNRLIGKMEMDKMFAIGDEAFVTLNLKDGEIHFANVIDHYRLDVELILFAIFFLAIVLVAGFTGLRAMLTFVFTALFLWKILFPAFLEGYEPVPIAVGSMVLLSLVIIFAIAGFTRKGLVAFAGAAAGVALTAGLSLLFGELFRIHGAVRPFSEALLYTGFPAMNLTGIFLAGIFIASAGAVMDVSMDISASMDELVRKRPGLSRREIMRSGLSVGRAVIGTMTTTLLLAYSGSYTGMFMLLMAQGTPIPNLLNLQYVSAEILHTLVGSFGLVTVAPLTALFGGLLLKKKAAPDAVESRPERMAA